ncbi:EF hand, partial [Ancylostoma duodenale]
IVPSPNDSEPVKRPIHLDGIQLERDGELNKEFRQEVLLGGDPKDSDELKEMVKKMFQETDTNNDGFLSVEELEERIVNNTRAHLEEGMVEAKTHFDIVDINKDGRVSWEEYEPHYLSKESGNDGHEHKTLGDNDKSLAGPERESFNRADVNGDGSLDPEEWLRFFHPEHNKDSLMDMAKDIFKLYASGTKIWKRAGTFLGNRT